MSRGAQLAAHMLSTACGVLMVAAAGIGSHGPTLVAATSAVVAVAVANPVSPGRHACGAAHRGRDRAVGPAATVAAVSGLSAAVYLVLRHAAGSGIGLDSRQRSDDGLPPWDSRLVGLVATAFPLQLPWLPLLAPLAVFAVYLLATRPFLREDEGWHSDLGPARGPATVLRPAAVKVFFSNDFHNESVYTNVLTGWGWRQQYRDASRRAGVN